ncbi:MAG: response regulator [Bacteroidetes bacterium]|nr:response regulator [Bacteroidota bacterium]
MEKEITRKIFVIEDNKTEGMLLKLCLSSIANVSISNFTNGSDLLNSISENPDIVIVDLMLPDISGIELIKRIKNFNPKINVIVVSAQRDIDVVAKTQELGVYNYLVKSETCIEYLQQVISNLITLLDLRDYS